MAAFLQRESREQPSARRGVREESCLFGCELSASITSFTFNVDEDDDSEHVLTIKLISLGDGAKDECNFVEVVALDCMSKEIVVPVANLKLSCQPMVHLDDFELRPPVTLRLSSGSGPVHVSGHHTIVSHDEDEEDQSDQENIPPVKPAKKKTAKAANAVINLT